MGGHLPVRDAYAHSWPALNRLREIAGGTDARPSQFVVVLVFAAGAIKRVLVVLAAELASGVHLPERVVAERADHRDLVRVVLVLSPNEMEVRHAESVRVGHLHDADARWGHRGLAFVSRHCE